MWCEHFFAEKPGNFYEIRQKFAALFAVVVEKNDCFVKVKIYVELSSNCSDTLFTEQKP